MDRKHGIALIGLGRIAKFSHFRNILCHPKLVLKYVVEKETAMASNFIRQYREDIEVVPPSDLQTVLEDKSVDATFICTTADSHEEYIKASLNAGKAVFCEKPLTTDEASTQSCYAEAKKRDCYCFVVSIDVSTLQFAVFIAVYKKEK
ncbi:myo-inositol 2-dehydrogenase-like [Amphiura filiformis]|uniref:myo-inositol 2-dehydrogenase-like n=1 Tax=Amphiura filiformis TaxID=82378 RepID=UPI003B2171AE